MSYLVDLALSAMALAVYSRTQQDPVAVAEACSTYDRLLPLLQERLTNVSALQQQGIDSTLLCIFLMGRYEGVMHWQPLSPQKSIQSWQGWSHHDGVMAVLKFWYDNFSHEPATSIVKHSRRGSIRSCLLRTRPLPSWLADGERFGEQGLDLEDDRIRVRTVSLRSTLAQLLANKDFTEQAESIDLEAQELDKALQDWAAKALSTYQLHTISAPASLPTKHLYAPIVYSYDTLGSAAKCAQYFAARMVLISTRIQVRAKATELTRVASFGGLLCDRTQEECTQNLAAMATSLASSIPFCLSIFEPAQIPGCRPTLKPDDSIRPWLAGLVVWPLSIASSLECVGDKQRSWFRSELVELGRIKGDRVFQETETGEWLRV